MPAYHHLGNMDSCHIIGILLPLPFGWALLRGSVIQANGRLAFEDGLSSGGPLHCVSHCTIIRTNLADIMDTLKKFKVPMLSEEVGC